MWASCRTSTCARDDRLLPTYTLGTSDGAAQLGLAEPPICPTSGRHLPPAIRRVCAEWLRENPAHGRQVLRARVAAPDDRRRAAREPWPGLTGMQAARYGTCRAEHKFERVVPAPGIKRRSYVLPPELHRRTGARSTSQGRHVEELLAIVGLDHRASRLRQSSLGVRHIYPRPRRYLESMSAYARQVPGAEDSRRGLHRGLSPSISTTRSRLRRTARSTFGTVTDIYYYLRLLWARSQPPCFHCGASPRSRRGRSIDHYMPWRRARVHVQLRDRARRSQGRVGSHLQELRCEGVTRVKIDGELRSSTRRSCWTQEVTKHENLGCGRSPGHAADLRSGWPGLGETAVSPGRMGIIEIETVPRDGEQVSSLRTRSFFALPFLRHLASGS